MNIYNSLIHNLPFGANFTAKQFHYEVISRALARISLAAHSGEVALENQKSHALQNPPPPPLFAVS